MQHQLQLLLEQLGVGAVHRDVEGLAPAHDQPVLVHLPGPVSQVVLVTPQVHVDDET